MTTNVERVELEQISCEVCKKEVPLTDATNPETADYIVHFCGLECYEEWKSQHEMPGDKSKKSAG
jgi:hypothetical protein